MVGQGLADRLTHLIMQKTSWTEQKEQKKRQRRTFVLGSFGLLALALIFAYMFVWQRVYTLQLADEHSQRKLRVGLLKERIQSLQNEVEYLSSIENIESIARNQLAMLPLREAQFAKAVVHQPKAPQQDTAKAAVVAAPAKKENQTAVKSKSTSKKSVSKSSTTAKKSKPVAKKPTTKKKGTGKTGR